jgi:hypothetical protein
LSQLTFADAESVGTTAFPTSARAPEKVDFWQCA